MADEKQIHDIERFMLYAHEYAYWNTQLAYQGVPRELVPIYIDLKMKQAPVPIEKLEESLHPDEVSEITLKHVTIRDDTMYATEEQMGDLVTHLSIRMDYYNKLKLVDKGYAQMTWDAERGEPVFTTIDSPSSSSEPD